MIRLLRLVRDHADAVEADLARHYPGTLLTDLWRPGTGLTLRRLRNLVHWLPEDAATWRVLGQRQLSFTENALARLWEIQAEKEMPDRPGPAYTPGTQQTGTPAKGSASMAARLAEHRQRYQDRLPTTA